MLGFPGIFEGHQMSLGARWSIVKSALGTRRYLLLVALTGLAGFFVWLLTFLGKLGVPISASLILPWIAAIAVIGFLIAFALLEFALKLQRRIKGARVELSRLRAAGVGIRNAGMYGFKDHKSWLAWKKKVEDWEQKVINAIGKVNEADAQWFHILDVVPPPRIPIDITDENETFDGHFELYKQHDFRVKRLGEMVRELWRE